MLGSRIVVPQGTEIEAEYLRGGDPFGSPSTLPPGNYIVDRYSGVWEDGNEDLVLILADADWDENGRVTYHSNKRRYRVQRSNLVVTIDLFPHGGG